ncbi:EF-hand domain-containing protein [Lysobacter xanthus]
MRPGIRHLGAALICAAPSFAALAGAPVASTGDYLARMDTDGDRRVSLAEFQAWMGYAFERMDRNGDGTVTPDELPGGRGKAVSLVEHRAALAIRFAKQDVNHDGRLDARELAAPPQR